MEVRVRGKHSSVPEPLKEYAVRKLSQLSRYLSTVATIDVEIYRDGKLKSSHVAHVWVATSGPVFRSRAVSDDPRRSIDIAFERLERRLKEFKRRRSGRPAHSRPKVESADMVERNHPGRARSG